MAIKSILFDADGVVINSEIFSVQYQKQFDISNDEMLPFFKGVFQDCLVGKADLKEVVLPYLKKWKWHGTIDEFLQFWFKAEHHIDEKIIKLIKVLREKNIKCYLVANQEKYRAEYIKNKMGFKDVFDRIFLSVDIGHKKPEKEFYEFILNEIKNEHKIYPHEIMFFDDSLEHVNKAKKLDIDAYFYKNFEEFKNLVKPILNVGILN